MRKYINKIENTNKFKIKTGYQLPILTPETIKLVESTKRKIKNDNSKNVCYLEITELVLIHCNVGNNRHQQKSRVL